MKKIHIKYLIISVTLLFCGCSPYDESIENPYNFVNDTDSTYSLQIVQIYTKEFDTFNSIVHKENLILSAGNKTSLLLPNFEYPKEKYLFIQIVKDNEIIYTFSSNKPISKGRELHIKENPLRIEIIAK